MRQNKELYHPQDIILSMKNITHDGRVIKVDGRDVTVCFIQSSACSGCHAKGICSSQDQAEKIVVADSQGLEYSVGEKVNIIVSNEMAWSAVVLAFLVPLVVAFIALFVSVPLAGEMMACLITLGVLAIYYVILFLQRDKLNRKVVFTIERS